MSIRSNIGFLAAVLVAIGGFDPAIGEPLGSPTEEPILTVTGSISRTNGDNAAVFDRAMLERLGTTRFRTRTPWHEGEIEFEGVLLRTVMQEVGATGDVVTATALNDYSSTLPMSDFGKYPVILAMKKDGVQMAVRDKGPLFIVYPYDSDPELRSNDFYARSVWQVRELRVH